MAFRFNILRPTHDGQAPMSLGDHLEELRTRLIVAILGLAPIFILSLCFGTQLMNILIEPVREQLRAQGQPDSLQAIGVAEVFSQYVKLSLLATVLLGSPWILYQLWLFIAPGLYRHERRFVHILLPLSTLLTVASMLFLYFVLLPIILTFFVRFGTEVSGHHAASVPLPAEVTLPTFPVIQGDPADPPSGAAWVNGHLRQFRMNVAPEGSPPSIYGVPLTRDTGIVMQPRLTDYMRWLLVLGAGFALAFQTPVVVLLLGWAGVIDPKTIAKYRKHAVLASFTIGAVLTPPDPVSQPLLSIPIYLLYELGLLLLKLLPARRLFKTESEMQDESGED